MMATRVVALIRFWVNHHLLDLTQRPVWRVVSGRSRTYVRAICSGAALALALARPVPPQCTRQHPLPQSPRVQGTLMSCQCDVDHGGATASSPPPQARGARQCSDR